MATTRKSASYEPASVVTLRATGLMSTTVSCRNSTPSLEISRYGSRTSSADCRPSITSSLEKPNRNESLRSSSVTRTSPCIRLREPCGQLQPSEAGTGYQDVLLHRFAPYPGNAYATARRAERAGAEPSIRFDALPRTRRARTATVSPVSQRETSVRNAMSSSAWLARTQDVTAAAWPSSSSG